MISKLVVDEKAQQIIREIVSFREDNHTFSRIEHIEDNERKDRHQKCLAIECRLNDFMTDASRDNVCGIFDEIKCDEDNFTRLVRARLRVLLNIASAFAVKIEVTKFSSNETGLNN